MAFVDCFTNSATTQTTSSAPRRARVKYGRPAAPTPRERGGVAGGVAGGVVGGVAFPCEVIKGGAAPPAPSGFKMAALRAAGAALLLRPGRAEAAAARLGYHKKVKGEGRRGDAGPRRAARAVGDAVTRQVVDHYENPRNVGSLDRNAKNVGTGLVGAPACGDVMKLQVTLGTR